MLEFSRAQRQELEQVAIAAYPQECCGILLGTMQAEPTKRAEPIKRVHQIWQTENAWTPAIEAEFLNHSASASASQASSSLHGRYDRFWIDPRELLRAQKWARSQDWVIVGIYHSHPNHPAVPSERDRQSAWPEYSYVILSVIASTMTSVTAQEHPSAPQEKLSEQVAQVADCSSWVLDADSRFQREILARSESLQQL